MSWLSLVTTCLLLGIVYGDYACVCSYNEEIDVLDKADVAGNVLGQMYEFDCKPDANMVAPPNWIAVLYQHQVGYIQVNTNINNQSCQGALPDEDKLSTIMPVAGSTPVAMMSSSMPPQTTTTTVMETTTTMQTQAPTTPQPSTGTPMAPSTMPPQTTTTTVMETTTTMQTQTPAPTTPLPGTTLGMATITGHIELCPSRIQQLATRNGAILAQFGDNCYEVVQNGVSWTHAEALCSQTGGHLAHVANQAEQDFIHAVLVKEHSHTVWLGLHDRASEEHFEWTSGNVVNYTNWLPGRKDYRYHNSEDCVFMTLNGQWDDIQCGGDGPFAELIQGHRHAYICQFATTNAAPLDGDLSKCSTQLQNQAIYYGGILAQHGNSCYELLYRKATWYSAESFCHSRGGHLATITNTEEQTFVMDFMSRHSANHAVWIGLNDKNSEGTFHWSSGQAVQYMNWAPNHLDNFNSHTREDCVLFIPYQSGEWDDVTCGSTGFFGNDQNQVHPYLCRFELNAGPGSGGIIGKK